MWYLIVSVPDHCLSFYLGRNSVIVGRKGRKHSYSFLAVFVAI